MEDSEDVSIVSVTHNKKLRCIDFFFHSMSNIPVENKVHLAHTGGATMGELFHFLLVGFWRQCAARAVC